MPLENAQHIIKERRRRAPGAKMAEMEVEVRGGDGDLVFIGGCVHGHLLVHKHRSGRRDVDGCAAALRIAAVVGVAAGKFHQASLPNFLRHQLCRSPHVLVHVRLQFGSVVGLCPGGNERSRPKSTGSPYLPPVRAAGTPRTLQRVVANPGVFPWFRAVLYGQSRSASARDRGPSQNHICRIPRANIFDTFANGLQSAGLKANQCCGGSQTQHAGRLQRSDNDSDRFERGCRIRRNAPPADVICSRE